MIDGLHDAVTFFRLAEDRDDHHLSRREPRRDDDSAIVAMRHDERPNHARRQAPAGRIHVLPISRFRLKRHVESFSKILPQMVGGAGLQRFPVAHHGLDRVGVMRAREFLRLRL